MNLKLIITVVLIGLLLGSCKNKESLAEAPNSINEVASESNPYLDNSTQFLAVKLTERTTYAGVRSNLAGNKNYTLTFKISDVKAPLEFTKLMIDSIALPFSNMRLDGERKTVFIVSKDHELVTLNSYKNLYSKDPEAPHMVEKVEYKESGLNLKGTAVVEYMVNGKPYYLEIPEITKLETIYAP